MGDYTDDAQHEREQYHHDLAEADAVLTDAGLTSSGIPERKVFAIAATITTLRAQLDAVRGERDAAVEQNRHNLRSATHWQGQANRNHDRATAAEARVREVEAAVRGVVDGTEDWDCSEVWDDDGDCIDNEAGEMCLRCAVIADLNRALLAPERKKEANHE